MDPLAAFSNIPIITDLILQHLSGTDLIRASEISPLYHGFIFNSSKCLRRINRKINARDTRTYPTQRMYHTVTVHKNPSKEIINGIKYVKSLELRDILVYSSLLRNLNSYCQDIEHLSFRGFSIREYLSRVHESPKSNFTKETLMLQKLKSVTLRDMNSQFGLADLIRICQKASELSLVNVGGSKIALDLLATIDFKLKKFRLSEYSFYNFDNEKEGLAEFLQSQLTSLEHLQLDIWTGIPSLQVIFKMPKLKILELYQLDKATLMKTDWNLVELEVNTSIIKLVTQDLRNDAKLLKKLFIAAPNVQVLKVNEVTADIADAIESHGKNLQKLEVDFESEDFVLPESLNKLLNALYWRQL